MSPAAQIRPSARRGSLAACAAIGSADEPLLGLLDGALEHIACARTRLEEGSFADQDQLLRTACSFIDQLRGTLTLHSGDPMTVNLDDLYDYVGRQLVLANSQDGLTTLDAVSHLLLEIRSAWQALPTQTHTPRPTAR